MRPAEIIVAGWVVRARMVTLASYVVADGAMGEGLTRGHSSPVPIKCNSLPIRLARLEILRLDTASALSRERPAEAELHCY